MSEIVFPPYNSSTDTLCLTLTRMPNGGWTIHSRASENSMRDVPLAAFTTTEDMLNDLEISLKKADL